MNNITYFVIAIIIGQLILTLVVSLLDFYYKPNNSKAKRYLKSKIKFGIIKAMIDITILLVIIYTQILNTLDLLVRTITQNQILTGLIFMGIIGLFLFVVEIPFSLYYIFVLEKKYSFNKTTKKTFIYDQIKSIVGYALIGAVGLSIILFFFDKAGSMAWLYCWAAVTIIQVFTLFIYPVFILPVFNKLKILKDGQLKDVIQKYLKKQGVDMNMNNIRIIDSSKRTKKSNAFLSGIGRNKRLVLSDTLLEKYSIDEILSIVAHEVGHYKKSHILKKLGIYVAESFLMFYILSTLIQNTNFFLAFGVKNLSVYMGLILFSIIYSPIAFFFTVIANYFSREFEYYADNYAATTTSLGAMASALGELEKNNLSNQNPHPLRVALEYSHPPTKDRIKRINEIQQ